MKTMRLRPPKPPSLTVLVGKRHHRPALRRTALFRRLRLKLDDHSAAVVYVSGLPAGRPGEVSG